MRCVNPVYVRLVDLWVPCGKCMPCRIQRANEWSIRLMHHLGTESQGGVFVTLTYDNNNVPDDGSLKKREFSLWIKRLRKEIEPKKIKYYGCGEYGEKGGRPHYHAIVFGLPLSVETEEIINKTWGQGFITLGTVTQDSCRYVSEYISKGMMAGTTIKQLQLDKKEPPFALMSHGIGEEYVKKNEKVLRETLETRVKNKKMGLPRYYKKVLGLTAEELAPKAKEVQLKRLNQLKKQVKGHEEHIFERVVSARRQTINNIVGKKAVKKARDPENR